MTDIDNILINIRNAAEYSSERHELILNLIDNFESEKIIPFLVKQIKESDINELNNTLIFACHEYSIEECIEHFDLFLHLLMHSNFGVALYCDNLLDDLRDYYYYIGKSRIRTALNQLNEKLKNPDDKTELLKDVIFYFEDYIENGTEPESE